MRPMGRFCRISSTVLIITTMAACQPGVDRRAEDRPAQGVPVKRAAGSGDYELGRRSLAAGDLGVAKKAFAAALRKYPNDPAVVLGMADTHFALGEYGPAEQLYDLLARKTPELADQVDQGRGLIALRKGQDDKAITFLSRSVEQNDALWRAWLGLGQAHARTGQLGAARRAFSAAERTAPVEAAVVNDIGMSYLHEKRPADAVSYFKKALRLDPGFDTARANLRIARAMNREYDAAVAGAPPQKLADVLNNVGYAAILNRDFDVADEMLRKAMSVSPVYHAAAAANLDLLAEVARSGPAAQRVAAKRPAKDPAPVAARDPAVDAQSVDARLAAAATQTTTRDDPRLNAPPVIQSTKTPDAKESAKPPEQTIARAQEKAPETSVAKAPVQAPAEEPLETADIPRTASRQFRWDDTVAPATLRGKPGVKAGGHHKPLARPAATQPELDNALTRQESRPDPAPAPSTTPKPAVPALDRPSAPKGASPRPDAAAKPARPVAPAGRNPAPDAGSVLQGDVAMEVRPIAAPKDTASLTRQPAQPRVGQDGFAWEENSNRDGAQEIADRVNALLDPAASFTKLRQREPQAFTWDTGNGLRKEPAPIPETTD